MNPAGYTSLGDATFIPLITTNKTLQISGAFTKTRGAHNLKIGAGVVSRRFRQFQSSSAVGTITFSTALTDNGAGSGGNSIASFLLGYPATVARTHTLFDPHYRSMEPNAYVQDDWRATSWLTLNLGVRYDVYTPLTEDGNHLSNIDMTALKLLVAGQNGVSETAGVNTDYSNLAPRFGFAATLPDQVVLRGGWGLSYFPGNYMSQSLMKNPPFVGTYGPVTSTGASGGVPSLRLSDGLPLPVATDAANPAGTIIGVAQDFKNTRVQQFNVIAEKEFAGNVFAAGYVGSRGANVAFAIPNLDLAPAAAGAIQQRRKYFAQLPGVTTIGMFASDFESTFLFDRADGTPLFPIEEQRVLESTVDGERASPTQPVPLGPAPFARQRLTEEMLTTRTPQAHQAALDTFRTFSNDGPFAPLGVGSQTIVFPGFDGGAEWGGSAFDPQTGVLYVNANEMAWTGGLAPNENAGGARQTYLRQCASCHRDDLTGAPPQMPSLVGIGQRRSRDELTTVIRQGAGRMPGFPGLSPDALAGLLDYVRTGRNDTVASAAPSPIDLKYRFTGYRKFLDPDGYPAIAPPWGTLSAIDLSTGEYAWKVPLGEYPELASQGLKNTGSENYGGPIVTAGGLVFIAATNFDRKLRAFDKATGDLVWETTLLLAGNATPSTYEVAGRQFIVVPAGGGRARPGTPTESGGMYVAFAVPKGDGSK